MLLCEYADAETQTELRLIMERIASRHYGSPSVRVSLGFFVGCVIVISLMRWVCVKNEGYVVCERENFRSAVSGLTQMIREICCMPTVAKAGKATATPRAVYLV